MKYGCDANSLGVRKCNQDIKALWQIPLTCLTMGHLPLFFWIPFCVLDVSIFLPTVKCVFGYVYL